MGWLFADRVLRMGGGLLIAIWTARHLGPDQFGRLSYAIVILVLFDFLLTLGLDNVVINNIVLSPAHAPETLGSLFALKLAGGGLAVVMALGTVYILRPADSLSFGLVAILAPSALFRAFDAIDFWFLSRVESKYSVIARNAAFVVAAIVRVLLIMFQAPLQAFAGAVLLETVLASLGLVLLYHLRGQRLWAWRFSAARVKRLLASGWPLMLSAAAIVVYMKVDVVMLQTLVGDQAVGMYSAATRISELWYFVPAIVVPSVFSALVNLRTMNVDLYYARLRVLFGYLGACGFAIALLTSLLSPALVSLLYGSSYHGAASVLAVHIWAAPFVFLGMAQSQWDISEGLTRLALARTLAGAVVNVALNALLIPRYAGLGAALATVVAYAFAACLGNLFDIRTRGIFRLQLEALLFVPLWQQLKTRLQSYESQS
jgi:PST family polysaccharide transporter